MGLSLSKSKKPAKSKANDNAITDVDRTILSLKTQKRKIDAQLALMEKRVDAHSDAARQLIREQRKERALLMLKKKKLTQNQISQLQGLVLNIEEMLGNVEMTKQQNRAMNALQQGNDTLKKLQAQFTLEDVQKVMDDTAEAHAYQEELQSILGTSLTNDDLEDVQAALAELEAETLAHEVAAMPVPPPVPEAHVAEELPSVPTTRIEVPNKNARQAVLAS